MVIAFYPISAWHRFESQVAACSLPGLQPYKQYHVAFDVCTQSLMYDLKHPIQMLSARHGLYHVCSTTWLDARGSL